MEIIIDRGGDGRCIYSETLDLAALGNLDVRRASHCEPDVQGQWWADLSPVSGPKLGPFRKRSLALAAEVDWLRRHVLGSTDWSDRETDPDPVDRVVRGACFCGLPRSRPCSGWRSRK